MKKTLIAVALLLPLSAYAGDKAKDKKDREGGPMHGPRMEHIMEELDLTDDQRTRMQAIFRNHHDKMTALREQTEAEVSKILTPEQQAKLDKMKQKRREKWEERKEKWRQQHGDDE